MLPISKIQEGDIFRPKWASLMWLVLEVDKEEKMVKIQAYDLKLNPIDTPMWVFNTNEFFSEANLIMRGDRTFLDIK